MARRTMPTEFGFATSPYTPPPQPRPLWRTLLFSAVLALIPVVGPALSAIYVDRRDDPESFDVAQALVSACVQLVAVALLVLVAWVLIVMVLGVGIQVNPQITGPGS